MMFATAVNYSAAVSGAGLGLRRTLMKTLEEVSPEQIQFMEVAPENWIQVGGRLAKSFRAYTERFPLYAMACLSLSVLLRRSIPNFCRTLNN